MAAGKRLAALVFAAAATAGQGVEQGRSLFLQIRYSVSEFLRLVLHEIGVAGGMSSPGCYHEAETQ